MKTKRLMLAKTLPLEDTDDYREQSINKKRASIKKKRNKMKHPMNGWEESGENEIQKCDSDTRMKN